MKTKFVFILLIGTLLMITTCSETEETGEGCYVGYIPFVQNYIGNWGFSEEYLDDYIDYVTSHGIPPVSDDYLHIINEGYPRSYFIKGVVTDKIDTGIRVKFLDDLKGNMTDSLSIIVYGDKDRNRFNNLELYVPNDTLLMMIQKCYLNNPEKAGDYTTFGNAWSVLRFADGFVTGYIHSLNGEPTLIHLDSLNGEMETMLWNDLQRELIDEIRWKNQSKLTPFAKSN